MEWYYSQSGDRTGPISEDEFQAAVSNGTITADTLVWNETMAEWQPYASLSGTQPAPVESTPADADAPAESAAPVESAAAVSGDVTVVCRECGGVADPNTMAPYGDQWVCSQCKDTFFQKIREGVNVDRADEVPGTGGTTPNAELMYAAREALTDRWGLAVGTVFVFGLLNVIAGGIFQGLSGGITAFANIPLYLSAIIATVLGWVAILAQGPLVVGLSQFTLNICDDNEPEFGDIFSGFSKFGQAVSAVLIQTVIIQLLYLPGQIVIQSAAGAPQMIAVGLGLIVLTLPVVIFLTMSWWLTTFAIADQENLGGVAALKYSWNLMNGNRFKLFCLFLRFTGWFLLCMLTCGIGFLWLTPYIQVATGMFYRDVHEPQ